MGNYCVLSVVACGVQVGVFCAVWVCLLCALSALGVLRVVVLLLLATDDL